MCTIRDPKGSVNIAPQGWGGIHVHVQVWGEGGGGTSIPSAM